MIEEIAITILSLASVSFAYFPGQDWRRWGCVFGLAAQPFWIIHDGATGSWALLPLMPIFSVIYGLAIWEHWVRPRRVEESVA